MNYTGPLGTLEQILQSLVIDLRTISIANGYTYDVYKVQRQYEGFSDYGGPIIAIQSATRLLTKNKLTDIVQKKCNIGLIAAIQDDHYDVNNDRTVVTSLQAFIDDIQKCLNANPYRTLVIGSTPTRLVWYSTVKAIATSYKPPLGEAGIILEVNFIDTK